MEVINLIGNILQMLIIPFLVFIIRMNMTLEKIKVETENHKKKIDKLDYLSHRALILVIEFAYLNDLSE